MPLGMPRYFLHVIVANVLIQDPEGIEVADLDAALVEVAKAADELRAEGLLDRELTESDRYEVTDEVGKVLVKVPLNNALRLH